MNLLSSCCGAWDFRCREREQNRTSLTSFQSVQLTCDGRVVRRLVGACGRRTMQIQYHSCHSPGAAAAPALILPSTSSNGAGVVTGEAQEWPRRALETALLKQTGTQHAAFAITASARSRSGTTELLRTFLLAK